MCQCSAIRSCGIIVIVIFLVDMTRSQSTGLLDGNGILFFGDGHEGWPTAITHDARVWTSDKWRIVIIVRFGVQTLIDKICCQWILRLLICMGRCRTTDYGRKICIGAVTTFEKLGKMTERCSTFLRLQFWFGRICGGRFVPGGCVRRRERMKLFTEHGFDRGPWWSVRVRFRFGRFVHR